MHCSIFSSPFFFGSNFQKEVSHSVLPRYTVSFTRAAPTGRTDIVWCCLTVGTDPISHRYMPHSPLLTLSATGLSVMCLSFLTFLSNGLNLREEKSVLDGFPLNSKAAIRYCFFLAKKSRAIHHFSEHLTAFSGKEKYHPYDCYNLKIHCSLEIWMFSIWING